MSANTYRYQGKTPRQWVANHERIHDPEPCEWGHLGCSCSKDVDGPCYDEMLASTLRAAAAKAEGGN